MPEDRQAPKSGVCHRLRIAQQVPVGINMCGSGAKGSDRLRPDEGIEFLFKKNKIDWIKGTARLTGRGETQTVDVFEGEKQSLLARKEIIIATGSAPRAVPGISIDRTRIITSDEAIGLRAVPASIAILGSGAVGVEFASIFRRFGSDVTIFELLPRLVPVEDEAVSAELEKSFRKQGMTAHTGARVTSAASIGDGVDIEAQLTDGKTLKIRVEYLLVATGRSPVTAGLDAEGRGLQLEQGYIKVDAQYRTSVRGISAIGDVITLGTAGHPATCPRIVSRASSPPERIAGRMRRSIRSRAWLHILRPRDRQRRSDRA